MFKVLYINTSDKMGGAAIAGDRLRIALRQISEIKDISLVHQKISKDANVFPVTSLVPQRFRKAESWIKQGTGMTGLQYRWMPFTHRALLAKAKAFKPHVINLHNLHAGRDGFVPVGLVRALSEIAPIVWTFHDMWPLTGHCAYAMDCERWQTGCGSCPSIREYPPIKHDLTAQNWLHKKTTFKSSDITVVTPSTWLANECKKSPLFEGKRIEVINNGTDLRLYRPGDKREARAALGLDEDVPVLMFVAQRANDNKRKGTKELFEIVDRLSTAMDRPVTLLTLGQGDVRKSDNPNVNVVSLGYVSDEEKIAMTYRAADLFLFPTRADNLPNSLVESICCGTPCATFDIGGCGEIIQDDLNGILVQPFDVDTMVARLLRFFASEDERARLAAAAAQTGHERYGWNGMAKKYLLLMRELAIARRNATE